MDKITVSSIADSKPSMVVSSQAAATLTVGAGELMIAMGTNVKDRNNTDVITAFQDLKDSLRESQYPVGASAVNYASGTPPSRAGYLVGNGAAIPALTENDAVIAYGATFYDAGNSVNIGAVIDRAIELFSEQILKFN